MTRRTQAYNAFNTGELDPRVAARADVKHYHSALATGKNLIGAPQGGVYNKFGTWHRNILRRKMVAVSLSGATVTAPSGGTAANATDGDSATSLTFATADWSAGHTVLKVDFGSAKTLAAFDLRNVLVGGASASGVLQVSYSTDDISYTNFGVAFPLSSTARTFRAALAPNQTATARYWKVNTLPTAALMVSLTLGDIFCWTPGALSAVKLIEINVDPASIYVLALTDQNADVFEGGTWRAAIRVPHTSDQIGETQWTQSIDTVLLFHPDVAPRKLLRLGAASLWSSQDQAFTNIPRFDFGDTDYANGADEEQVISFSGFGNTAAGAAKTKFTLTIESYATDPITYTNNATTLGAAITAAIEALPNVDAGVTVTFDDSTKMDDGNSDSGQIRIKFTGGANANRPWLQTVPQVVSTAGTESVFVTRSVKGLKGGEDLWSPTRGYPRHGVFFQQRLLMGGFRSRGNAQAYSVTADFFNFDVNLDAPTGAILDLLDADDDRTIMRYHVGQYLHIFTNTSAHFLSDRAVDRDQPRNYVESGRSGIVAGARSIDLQGDTLFVEVGGAAVLEFVYSQLTLKYEPSNLTLLSAHLFTGALDLAVRRSSTSGDADLVLVVNADGTLVILTALHAEQVDGITWCGTETGLYRSAAVDNTGLVHLARERSIAGATEIVLETHDFAIYLDAAVTGTVSGANVTGLAALEGAQVWAYLDGSPYGPFTVSGGQIAHGLTDAPAAAIVGLWSPPVGVTLPMRPEDSEAAPRRKKRIHKVWASIFETGNIALAANGGDPVEVPLWGFSAPIDTPLLDRLVTGEVKRAGILGWSMDGQIRFTQTVPAPLHLRALRAELDG